jgi:hypothetical protein
MERGLATHGGASVSSRRTKTSDDGHVGYRLIQLHNYERSYATMAESKIDFNALGQAIDTSWGRSSTPKTASYSVKFSLAGGPRLIASYQAVVNFGTEREMILMKRNYAEESVAIINEVLKSIKAVYKDLSDDTLKTKEASTTDSVEIIGFGVHTAKRTAYYRRKTVFELG